MNQSGENPLDYNSMEKFFSNANLFRFIWKWKWVFSISFIVACILGYVFSGPSFITPKFKSESIVYPLNLNEYGDESSAEQMLQFLQSDDLKFELIRAFDLYAHYEIDPEAQFAQSYIFEELNDHLSFSKTSLESVRITVLDKDPERAAAMVDSVNFFYNHLVKSIDNFKTKERIDRDSKEMAKITVENDSLKHKLLGLRKQYNLINPKKQTREITEAYLKNNPQAEKLYKNMVEYKDEIIFLDSLVTLNNGRFFEYKNDHDEQLTELNREQIYSSVISKAIPADKKSYPVRWLILSGVVLASLVFTFVVLLIIDNLSSAKKES